MCSADDTVSNVHERKGLTRTSKEMQAMRVAQRKACKGCVHNDGETRFNFWPCLSCAREIRRDRYNQVDF
jgi:hypothetical protein